MQLDLFMTNQLISIGEMSAVETIINIIVATILIFDGCMNT